VSEEGGEEREEKRKKKKKITKSEKSHRLLFNLLAVNGDIDIKSWERQI